MSPLVTHVGEHRALYTALVGTSCKRAVNRRFNAVVTELIERELGARKEAYAHEPTAVRYLTGAFCETLTFWLGQRDAPSASMVERMLKDFSQPVFERGRRACRAE